MTYRATPVPIPNTTVKPIGADDTAGAALWESRGMPVTESLDVCPGAFFLYFF